jgi:hypothetical protein
MHRCLCLILFFAAVLPAYARLGETKEQSIARYETPVPQAPEASGGEDILLFKKNGIEINATFENGKCVDLTFLNLDHSDFTDDEINTLLSLNSQGLEWKVNPTPHQYEGCKTVKEWTRTDGADACHSLGEGLTSDSAGTYSFEICTKEYNDKLLAEEAADAKQKAADAQKQGAQKFQGL